MVVWLEHDCHDVSPVNVYALHDHLDPFVLTLNSITALCEVACEVFQNVYRPEN
jgi:hypothetical protein